MKTRQVVPSRQYLAEYGLIQIDHLHYEEYIYSGVRYGAGWASPWRGRLGGWDVWPISTPS